MPNESAAQIEALRRIEKCGLKEGKYLDLSWIGYLPKQAIDLRPLKNLRFLEVLKLDHTAISDLRPLKRLTLLQELNLEESAVEDLNPLEGLRSLEELNLENTPIIDLEPLRKLNALRELNLHDTEVVDLDPLRELNALQKLDISDTKVLNLDPIKDLVALHELQLDWTKVTRLEPLKDLINLRILSLRNTEVAALDALKDLQALRRLDLEKTLVEDIQPLKNLHSLQKLDLHSTKVTDLEPLKMLKALQELDLWDTRVANIEPVRGLTALKKLSLGYTQVSTLEPLRNLLALEELVIWNTSVADLGPLNGLPALQRVEATDSEVTDLAPLLHLIREDKEVGFSACPLLHPPPEVAAEGRKAILNYFDELEAQGRDQLFEAKVLLLGAGRTGKTSLLRRLYYPEQPLPTENETTKGIQIHRHEFKMPNGTFFGLSVWDFGGQQIYHATHQFFLTRHSLYILLDDTAKDDKSVHDEGFRYWLEVIETFGEGSPVIIFQNEKGGRSKAIDEAGIKGRFPIVKDIYQGNLKEPRSAEALRSAIEQQVQLLPHIGDEVPAKWVSIRNAVEKCSETNPYISQDEYFAIYEEHLEFDRVKALHLSSYLHNLGIFLHFQGERQLSRIVILQNRWATDAVFRILDDATVISSFGHFTISDCDRVWESCGYVNMHQELIALMEKFELCYQLADTTPETWLAPQLLSPSTPDEFKEWEDSGDLVLSYCYDFLPKGMVSRLMVRMHRFARTPEKAWATGVLFEYNDTQLLVRQRTQDNRIDLRSRGPEQRHLLSVIANDLDALNDNFQGLKTKPQKLVPCNCDTCSGSITPTMFKEEDLRIRKEAGKMTIECPTPPFENVQVLQILDGNSLADLPSWMQGPLLKTIKIFLASSAELREDRDAFDLYFRQCNDWLREEGYYLEIIRWENFLDAMSDTRLQDEYNKAVRSCDIFVSLFRTKTGQFTEEEFDVAHESFCQNGKPLIYTFFKEVQTPHSTTEPGPPSSLRNFKEKLKELGHYYTFYKSKEHLKRHFRDQLDLFRHLGPHGSQQDAALKAQE